MKCKFDQSRQGKNVGSWSTLPISRIIKHTCLHINIVKNKMTSCSRAGNSPGEDLGLLLPITWSPINLRSLYITSFAWGCSDYTVHVNSVSKSVGVPAWSPHIQKVCLFPLSTMTEAAMCPCCLVGVAGLFLFYPCTERPAIWSPSFKSGSPVRVCFLNIFSFFIVHKEVVSSYNRWHFNSPKCANWNMKFRCSMWKDTKLCTVIFPYFKCHFSRTVDFLSVFLGINTNNSHLQDVDRFSWQSLFSEKCHWPPVDLRRQVCTIPHPATGVWNKGRHPPQVRPFRYLLQGDCDSTHLFIQ